MLGLDGRAPRGDGEGDLFTAAEAAGIDDFELCPFDSDNPDAREVNDHERLWLCTDYVSAYTHWAGALGEAETTRRIRQIARDILVERGVA